MAHLVTGYAGYEHIKAEDDGAFNAAFFGDGQFVMGIGNKFEGSIIDNNTVRILGGDGLMYGRHFRITSPYEDLNITTGTSGKNRIDLICMTYEKNASDETESVRLEVIKGTETTGTPAVPAYTNGNILEGATFNQMPLYKVKVEGVVLAKIEAVFETLPSYKDLAKMYESRFINACETHLNSLDVLDTCEEIKENTKENQLSGALAMKEHLVATNPHNMTKKDLGLENVENKSSETIRGELTKENVTNALGYTPPTTNTTYSAATETKAGLMPATDKKKLNGINVIAKTFTKTVSGTGCDINYSEVGLTPGVSYVICVQNGDYNASTFTVQGVTNINNNSFRVYWDDTLPANSQVRLNMMAIKC